MFVFVTFLTLNFDFTDFTSWYYIKYLGDINWEVVVLAELGKLRLPCNF